MTLFIGVNGCPFPDNSYSAAPPPPAPAPAPSNPVGSLTATGTARNGPGRYAGFRVTAQSVAGPVRIYNGPDATYPLVQEVASPVVGTWNYVESVSYSDSTTWSKLQNAWSTLGGTGQTVEYMFEDFVGSMYAASSQAAELTRISAAYTGSTFYWKAKVTTPSGDGTGSSPANAINGSKALAAKITAGTIKDGDIVEFDYSNGACTIASEGADWPCTSSITTKFTSGSAKSTSSTTPCGMIFGNVMTATSTCSNIWFKFDSSQTAIDASGATNTNRRQWAAFRAQGEGILVSGLKVIPPNWSYLIDPTTGATRISGPSSNAEDASYENHGIIVFGNGNHIHNCTVTGDKSWSTYGILYMASELGVTEGGGPSAGLRGSISYCSVQGVLTGIQARAFGATGYDLEVPCGLDIHHNTVSNPGWGHNVSYLNLSGGGSGNAAGHGNGISLHGKWFGGLIAYSNEVTGGFQDGFSGVAAGVVIADNYIHDLNRTSTRTEWYWNTTPNPDVWATRTVSNTEGNGIKGGLTNKDLRSPSTWLGTDGVAMTDTIYATSPPDHCGVDELRWVIVRNIIHNVQASGITSNESNGGFVACNEIVDPQGTGILILGQAKSATQARQQNWYLANNFIKKTVTGPSSWCIRFESGTNNVSRIWFHNNIVWCGASQNDMFIGSGITFVENTKNVFTKGTSFSGTYSTTNNLTDATSKADAQLYVLSVAGVKTSAGLPVGNSLRTAGAVTPQTAARTYGCSVDFRGALMHATTPCVGPANAP